MTLEAVALALDRPASEIAIRVAKLETRGLVRLDGGMVVSTE